MVDNADLRAFIESRNAGCWKSSRLILSARRARAVRAAGVRRIHLHRLLAAVLPDVDVDEVTSQLLTGRRDDRPPAGPEPRLAAVRTLTAAPAAPPQLLAHISTSEASI